MPTPHTGYQFSEDPLIEEMYKDILGKKQTGASKQGVKMDNQYNIDNTTQKDTSAGGPIRTIPTQGQNSYQNLPFTPPHLHKNS
jgi:hypothetical protein